MNTLRTITQKYIPKLLVVSLIVGVVVAIALSSNGSSKAAGADSLSLSPSSGSYNSGTTFTVNVDETSGDTISAADADLTFNASQLQYISSSTAGAFNLCVPTTSSSEVNLACDLSGSTGLTGTQLIGTVTFKTLSGTGRAAISFGSQSSILLTSSGAETWNGATAAASYTLTTPVVTPPVTTPPVTTPPSSGGGGTTSSGGSSGSTKSTAPTTSTPTTKTSAGTTTTTASTPAGGASAVSVPATVTPTASNPAPVISAVSVSNISTSSVTVSWQTNIPATSVVEYGLSSKYSVTTQDNTPVTSHQVILSAPNIASATRYQFVVMSVSSSGVGATSAAQTFTTLGFPVTIRVVDAHGKLIKGAKVVAGGQTETTNSAGLVTFQNLPSGLQTIVIKAGNKLTKRTITVNGTIPESGSSTLQQFSLSAIRGTTNPLYYVITIVVIVFAAGGALFMPRGRLSHSFPMMAHATAGVDLDIRGTNEPVVNTSVPPEPRTMGGVTAVATHEPGQVIAPSGSQPADDPVNPVDDPPTQGPVPPPPSA